MRLFKRRQKQASQKQEAIALGIAERLLRFQRKLADRLNKGAAGLPLNTVKVLLMLFCLLFTAVNLYLLINSI